MEDNNKIVELREDNKKNKKGIKECIKKNQKKCGCLIF